MKFHYFLILILLSSCVGPKAGFTYVQEIRTAPSAINFENQSLKAVTCFWDFGDGNISEEFNPKHTYISSGRFVVTLHAFNKDKSSSTKKEIFIDPPLQCLVEIKTSAGVMIAQLYDETPLHRDNFLKLVEDRFYNDLLFHRVIKGFMVQTGDPESKNAPSGKDLGGGGPDYKIKAEIIDTFVHVKGVLAAARFSDQVNPKKESSGSQFYIVHGKPISEQQLENYELEKNIKYQPDDKEIMLKQGGAPQLDMEYTVFGKIIDGLETIDAIADNPTDKRDRPVNDIKIISIKIIK